MAICACAAHHLDAHRQILPVLVAVFHGVHGRFGYGGLQAVIYSLIQVERPQDLKGFFAGCTFVAGLAGNIKFRHEGPIRFCLRLRCGCGVQQCDQGDVILLFVILSRKFFQGAQ